MTALISLIIVIGLAMIWHWRKPSPHDKEAPPANNPNDLERQINAMSSKLAALEHELSQITDDDEAQPDLDPRADWDSSHHGPSFEFGMANIPLHLQYTDANGNETRRDVIVLKFGHSGRHGSIYAYCRLRAERRTFLFSRIRLAVDPATGEVIDDLGEWLETTHAATPEGKAEAIADRHSPALLGLFYVARADGAFRAAEKQAVIEFLTAQGCDESTAARVVKAMSQWTVPTAIGFGKSLKALASEPATYRQHFSATAQRMVASDKSMSPAETRALERIRRELPRE